MFKSIMDVDAQTTALWDTWYNTETALVSFSAGDAVEIFDEKVKYLEGVEFDGKPVVEEAKRARVCVVGLQGVALRVFDPTTWERRRARVLRGSDRESPDPRNTTRV